MSEKIITLDVRADLYQGREPFSKIMDAVDHLQPDEKLLLIAPFQPSPLFRVMAAKGFIHNAKPTDQGDWEVLFTRKGQPVKDSEPLSCRCSHKHVIESDARGMEPPQPLVTILEAVENIPEGAELRAFTDRRPMHLYAALAERGYDASTDEQADGSFVTIIRRSQCTTGNHK